MKKITDMLMNIILVSAFLLVIYPLKVIFKLAGYDPLRLRFQRRRGRSLFGKINGETGIKRSFLNRVVDIKSNDMSSCSHPDTIYPLS